MRGAATIPGPGATEEEGCLIAHAGAAADEAGGSRCCGADGGGCEDSVNIIKRSGKIEKIEVSNAFSDAVDIDFSNIIIKQLNVTQANNDCFDVSGGEYYIENALLNKCGDKGISVGESSELQGTQIKINDSNIGIASKDSSITNIQYFLANNMNMCLEAKPKTIYLNNSLHLLNNNYIHL